MRCMVGNVGLLVAERRGIANDHCPTCRGIRPDRGELNNSTNEREGFNENEK